MIPKAPQEALTPAIAATAAVAAIAPMVHPTAQTVALVHPTHLQDLRKMEAVLIQVDRQKTAAI